MSYRVVYGETMPAWERIFSTKREAERFVKHCKHVGDIVFSISKIVPNEKPQSLMAAIEQGEK